MMPFDPLAALALPAAALVDSRMPKTLLQKILSGRSEANIRFADLRVLMQHLGFEERIRGSHHVYRKESTAKKVNLRRDGGNA